MCPVWSKNTSLKKGDYIFKTRFAYKICFVVKFWYLDVKNKCLNTKMVQSNPTKHKAIIFYQH